jgi:hypothetical protein
MSIVNYGYYALHCQQYWYAIKIVISRDGNWRNAIIVGLLPVVAREWKIKKDI